MQIRAVACELPHPEYLLIFHAHVSEDVAVWQEADLNRYLDLQAMITRLYRRQVGTDRLTDEQAQALYVPELTLEQALQRLLPVMVEANRTQRSSLFLHRTRNRVVARRRVGIGDGYPHLRQVVLAKAGAEPPEGGLQERCDPKLVAQVLRSPLPAQGPRWKVVTLPAHFPVRLSANRSGEVIKEIARVWG